MAGSQIIARSKNVNVGIGFLKQPVKHNLLALYFREPPMVFDNRISRADPNCVCSRDLLTTLSTHLNHGYAI